MAGGERDHIRADAGIFDIEWGTASVSGMFAWTTPTIVPSAGTPSESVTFTPTDTTDYNAVTGSVNLTVNPALPP